MTARQPSQRLLAATWAADPMAGHYADDVVPVPTYDYTWVSQVPVAYGSAVALTAQNAGSNFTVTGGATSMTTQSVVGNATVTGSNATAFTAAIPYRQRAPALQVVRHYSRKKIAMSRAAVTPDIPDAPSTPDKESVTCPDNDPDVLVSVGEDHDTVQVTNDEAVQVLEHGHQHERMRIRRHRRRPVHGTAISPARMTRIAVSLVGQKRPEVGGEWQSHLFGEPGRGLSQQDQMRAARGFLWSAVRFRLQDAADLAWRPIDAVLGSRVLSNLFVWGPVLVVLITIVRHDGRYGLVADDQDPIELGLFLYGAIKVGRWYRKVKPPEPKAWSAKE